MHKHSPSSDQRHALYYQAIIQLRPANERLIEYTLNYLKNKEDVTIAKREKLKTGIDLYISSNRVALALGKRLKQVFPGELTLSRELHTRDRQTSRDLYRVTVLFRLQHEHL